MSAIRTRPECEFATAKFAGDELLRLSNDASLLRLFHLVQCSARLSRLWFTLFFILLNYFITYLCFLLLES